MKSENTQPHDEITQIASQCAYANLATCDGGQPRVRPVSAFMQNDLSVLVPTFAKSRKMAQIDGNPKVEICFVDDQHRQVRVEGAVARVDDVAVKQSLMETTLTPEMWGRYFKGPDDPNFTLLRIVPSRIEWNQSGDVSYKTWTP